MKKLYWILSVLLLLVTALLAIKGSNEWLRLLSLPMALGSVGCAVRALNTNAQSLDINALGAASAPLPRPRYGAALPAPPAPTMPSGLTRTELASGSLRGAANSMDRFAACFAAQPMASWQFRRIAQSVGQLASAATTDEQLTATGDFAVRYLPSVMQYLSACNAEGCPENAADVLADIATVCEAQQSALQALQAVRFDAEYVKLRRDIEAASFRWC